MPIHNDSPYFTSPFILDDGVLGLYLYRNPPRFVVDANTRIHVVVSGQTLNQIAHTYYGKGRLWHILWDANQPNLTNPFLVEAGTRLVIPDLTRISF